VEEDEEDDSDFELDNRNLSPRPIAGPMWFLVDHSAPYPTLLETQKKKSKTRNLQLAPTGLAVNLAVPLHLGEVSRRIQIFTI
jgi:hypothetical protein